jgi:hypothetical protein
MIGRAALGLAPLFACLRSFVARDSFCPGHRCAIPYIDDVNINLTGVAFASSRIFTLSTFGSGNTRARLSRPASGTQRRHRVPVTSPQPPDRVRARPVLHLQEPAALPPQLHNCSLKVVALRMAGARPRRILAGYPFPIMAGPARPSVPHVAFIMRPMNETRYKEVLSGSAR